MEINFARRREGLYFHFSNKAIVTRVTHTRDANSSCVRLFRARSSFMIFFMIILYQAYNSKLILPELIQGVLRA